jgi:RND family efflux transporter MFP subunit
MALNKSGVLFLLAMSLGFTHSAIAESDMLKSVPVQYEQVEIDRVFDGVVESKYLSTVSSQTSGQVSEIYFDVNDVVPEGAVILRLNDTEQQARLLEARANVKNAAVLLQEARDEYQRISNLADRKLVSQSELDRARTQLEATRARHEQMQAQLTVSQRHLDYTAVKAPYSGVLVARHVQIGESVQVGQPLLTGFSLENLRVITAIPSEIVPNVRNQGAVAIQAPSIEALTLTGDAITVFPYADERTHNFTVRIDLPDKMTGLYPGNFVKAAFMIGHEARLLAPKEAVVKRSEVTGVYVISPQDEKVNFRYVVTGKPYDDKVEILSGLREGELVAVDPTAAAIQLKTMAR